MTFHQVLLPTDIERGAIGGPEFNNTIFQADSGEEQRNQNWSEILGRWDIGYGLMQKFRDGGVVDADVDTLIHFFYGRRGNLHTFMFRDWADFDIGRQTDPLGTRQRIGLGDDVTTVFQTYKLYDSTGPDPFQRPVYLIEPGTYFFYIDGVLLIETTDYTLNQFTGVVTLTSPLASTGGTGPGGKESLEVTTRYYNIVRLDTPWLQINMQMFAAGSWPNIPIVGQRPE